MNDRQTVNQRASLTLDDVYYVLFKHKWKIIFCSVLGLLVAAAVVEFRPRMYQSEAKLFIRYVLDSKSPAPTPDSSRMISSYDGQNVISSEMEILTSLDLAEQVVDMIGAEKILAKAGGGKDRIRAANLVRNGVVVEVPNRSNVMRILFQHPDPDIVQPVLTGLIDNYFKKHAEIHQALGSVDDLLSQETDQLRTQLAQTEDDLRQARNKAGVISLADSTKNYADEIAKIQQEVFDAQADLAEHQAMLKAMSVTPLPVASQSTNDEPPRASLPVDEYKSVSARIDDLWKREREMLTQFTEENTLVKGIRQQITEAEQSKQLLEEKYPALTRLDVVATSQGPQRDGSAASVASETRQVLAIQTKIKVLNDQLEQIHKEANVAEQMEATISELQRKKQLEESNYQYFSSTLEQARIDEAINHGKISNISKIQAPTPPFPVPRGSVKKIAMIAAGGVALGLGWAFLLELCLDRTVKRPIDVQSKLRLPLFLVIPDFNRNGHGRLSNGAKGKLPPPKPAGAAPAAAPPPAGAVVTENQNQGMEAWSSRLPLRTYYEALRDRLVMYFEVRGITHKPKLIAVTSAGRGAGVTSTAAGLAATLSETGDGNVLLVDMNEGQGAAQQFCQGRPVAKLEEALYRKDNAQVQDKLYVATEAEQAAGSKLPRILPKRFTNLVPKLKVSDYDYIIFDMPAITQTSVTPRLAGFMDMVLLVIESEKTDRNLIQQSCALLAESKANVSAVLNKTHTYVPPRLHQEYLGDS
ncbi:MAG TPA: Wzz/FepE/Etk N-terminal domain-containing protein [Verrucomicrobiae bacterium]|nr:Wzz/FepE/Etk N-terminal domain-containing protein [Verrucomicrobiae bacterium]